jgi:hypothetical protein
MYQLELSRLTRLTYRLTPHRERVSAALAGCGRELNQRLANLTCRTIVKPSDIDPIHCPEKHPAIA